MKSGQKSVMEKRRPQKKWKELDELRGSQFSYADLYLILLHQKHRRDPLFYHPQHRKERGPECCWFGKSPSSWRLRRLWWIAETFWDAEVERIIMMSGERSQVKKQPPRGDWKRNP